VPHLKLLVASLKDLRRRILTDEFDTPHPFSCGWKAQMSSSISRQGAVVGVETRASTLDANNREAQCSARERARQLNEKKHSSPALARFPDSLFCRSAGPFRRVSRKRSRRSIPHSTKNRLELFSQALNVKRPTTRSWISPSFRLLRGKTRYPPSDASPPPSTKRVGEFTSASTSRAKEILDTSPFRKPGQDQGTL